MEREDMVTLEDSSGQYTHIIEGLLGSRILGASSQFTRRKWNPSPPLFLGRGKDKYEP